MFTLLSRFRSLREIARSRDREIIYNLDMTKVFSHKYDNYRDHLLTASMKTIYIIKQPPFYSLNIYVSSANTTSIHESSLNSDLPTVSVLFMDLSEHYHRKRTCLAEALDTCCLASPSSGSNLMNQFFRSNYQEDDTSRDLIQIGI